MICTYVIQAGKKQQDCFIKIGRSSNPKARLKQLQTGNPLKLRLLVVIKGDYEAKFHDLLSQYRAVGEWFEGVDVELLDRYIKMIKTGTQLSPNIVANFINKFEQERLMCVNSSNNKPKYFCTKRRQELFIRSLSDEQQLDYDDRMELALQRIRKAKKYKGKKQKFNNLYRSLMIHNVPDALMHTGFKNWTIELQQLALSELTDIKLSTIWSEKNVLLDRYITRLGAFDNRDELTEMDVEKMKSLRDQIDRFGELGTHDGFIHHIRHQLQMLTQTL